MVYPALLTLMRTRRLPVVDWTDAPADLNGLVHFAERRNLVSGLCHHISTCLYLKISYNTPCYNQEIWAELKFLVLYNDYYYYYYYHHYHHFHAVARCSLRKKKKRFTLGPCPSVCASVTYHHWLHSLSAFHKIIYGSHFQKNKCRTSVSFVQIHSVTQSKLLLKS